MIPSRASSSAAFARHHRRGDRVRVGLGQPVLRVERALAERDDRSRSIGVIRVRERVDGGVELLGRHDAVHEAPVGRGRGVDRIAGEQHLERALAPDRAHDRNHRRRAEQPDVDAGSREPGVGRRDREIARRRRAGIRPPSRCRARARSPVAGSRAPRSSARRRSRTARRRSSSGGRPSRRGRDRPRTPGPAPAITTTADARLSPTVAQRAEQLAHRGERQRVAALGAVERQPRDRPARVDDQGRRVRHGSQHRAGAEARSAAASVTRAAEAARRDPGPGIWTAPCRRAAACTFSAKPGARAPPAEARGR